MKSQEIRDCFVDYFVQRSHKHIPAAPLVPVGDPTLLFTTAGMVQFKPLWEGTAEIKHPRAVTVQKCLRLSDLENVGKTPRHDTLFEMLGNFSFGDYFKREAIDYAWEFLTEVLSLSPDRLWITVYKDDDEAKQIWLEEKNIPSQRVVSLGDEENFWGPAGESGACGPCSEIIYDLGEEKGCGEKDCGPACECGRWLEVWNLVFPQYDKRKDGSFQPLKNRGIDTGMGLERLAMILQQKDSIFQTDLFFPIIKESCSLADCSYGQDPVTDRALNIIADHVRALTFAIAENVTPSNEGRGYVLRRLVRRASKYGRDLGLHKPFLYTLVNTVIDIMHQTYPELVEKTELIKQILMREEERFLKTLDQGMSLLQEVIEDEKKKECKVISGKTVFTLYDTYGFPVEMTEEILSQEGLVFDREQFESEQSRAKEIARSSWQDNGTAEEMEHLYRSLFEEYGKTRFTGYEKHESTARILSILQNGRQIDSKKAGDEKVEIVLDETPFYAESGGQVADTGYLIFPGGKVRILDVAKTPDALFVHSGKIEEGEIKVNTKVTARIDFTRRREIMKHHTCTHLLQAALREVLGNHIGQTGSYVCEDHFRFDFTHFQAPSQREIELITKKVNEYIQLNKPVHSEILSLQEAKERGALAFFGEKYGETVRVITIPDISLELCGGTHLDQTGYAGIFQVVSEASVAAGVRRIEAVVGENAVQEVIQKNRLLGKLENMLKTDMDEIPAAVERLEKDLHELQRENRELRQKDLFFQADELLEESPVKNGIKVVVKRWQGRQMKELLPLADHIRQKSRQSAALLFINEEKNKVQLLVALTEDLTDRYHAGKMVKELAGLLGGGGGGKPDCAQAGGKKPENIPDVIKRFEQFMG